MHLVKEDILHQVNCVRDRLEEFDTISQGHLRMLLDCIESMQAILDRRSKQHPVSEDRRNKS